MESTDKNLRMVGSSSFQFVFGLLDLFYEDIGRLEIRRGGEAADPGEFVEVVDAKIDALAAAHGQAGECAVIPMLLELYVMVSTLPFGMCGRTCVKSAGA
jgi:hypothetical protein